MSDQRLRSAARAAAIDGSPEAQAALLQERLRAGTTTHELVSLAAYCGDPAARLLLAPRDCPPSYAHSEQVMHSFAWAGARNEWPFQAWVCGLTKWHNAVPGIAAVVAAELALPIWVEQHKLEDRGAHSFSCPDNRRSGLAGEEGSGTTKCVTIERVFEVVRVCRRWVDCLSFPCIKHAEPCRAASAALLSDQPGFAAWLGLGIFHRDEDDGLHLFMQSIKAAVAVVGGRWREEDLMLAGLRAGGGLSADGEEKIAAAVRPAVIKWALRELR